MKRLILRLEERRGFTIFKAEREVTETELKLYRGKGLLEEITKELERLLDNEIKNHERTHMA